MWPRHEVEHQRWWVLKMGFQMDYGMWLVKVHPLTQGPSQNLQGIPIIHNFVCLTLSQTSFSHAHLYFLLVFPPFFFHYIYSHISFHQLVFVRPSNILIHLSSHCNKALILSSSHPKHPSQISICTALILNIFSYFHTNIQWGCASMPISKLKLP